MRTRLVLLAWLCLAVAACGYRWVRYGEGLGDVRRVAIQTLHNDSYEPGVELIATEALLREFLRRGAVELVEEPNRADLVLSGAVRSVETRRRSLSSVVFVLEYEVVLRLELHARRADGREVVIDPGALREAELFLASADVEVTRKNRQEALRRLAGLLAGRVHDALAEGLGS